MKSKKAKKIYDKLRYRKKKLINIIEKMQKHKNIYDNKDRNIISNYTKKDIEELYKKAVYDKDKKARSIINKLGNEYKGSFKTIEKKYVDNLQKDLQVNIYGTKISKLRPEARADLENFKTLMNGLTTEQKAEFLNSNSYYGARRYQKPPAESESFNLQVIEDGASYIVDNLKKYYEDNGLILPDLKQINKVSLNSKK